MAVTSLASLKAAISRSQRFCLLPVFTTALTSGVTMTTSFVATVFGTLATPAVAGSGGTSYSQSGSGNGYPAWNAAPAGQVSYIHRGINQYIIGGTGILYDLLWGCSGFVTNTTTSAQTVSSTTLPSRNGSAVNAANEMWLFIGTTIGVTQTNVQISYTNQSGTAGRTATATLAASAAASRIYPCLLQSGDTGVQSVQSVTFQTLTGTDGAVSLLLMNRIAHLPGSPAVNYLAVSDFASSGLPQVADQAVILPVFLPYSSSGASGPGCAFEIIQG